MRNLLNLIEQSQLPLVLRALLGTALGTLRAALCCLPILGMSGPSLAAPEQPVLSSLLQTQEVVGQGKYRYLWLSVYDATLLAPQGQWRYGRPFALELAYHRNLSGQAIAKRSVEEMRQQGFDDELALAAWFEQMKKIFPDVRSGSSLTGVFMPEVGVYFYYNGQPIGLVSDLRFAKQFFDIWLSEKTTAPELRQALLGAR